MFDIIGCRPQWADPNVRCHEMEALAQNHRAAKTQYPPDREITFRRWRILSLAGPAGRYAGLGLSEIQRKVRNLQGFDENVSLRGPRTARNPTKSEKSPTIRPKWGNPKKRNFKAVQRLPTLFFPG